MIFDSAPGPMSLRDLIIKRKITHIIPTDFYQSIPPLIFSMFTANAAIKMRPVENFKYVLKNLRWAFFPKIVSFSSVHCTHTLKKGRYFETMYELFQTDEKECLLVLWHSMDGSIYELPWDWNMASSLPVLKRKANN